MINEAKKFYQRLGRPINDYSLDRRWQDVLRDKKWKRFLKMSWPFAYLPFIDFALGAGSMALGNIHTNSDFDVIVGCRNNRIFTARFFCVLVFGLLGWRRRKLIHNEEASDKICFNHFVTKKSFRLSQPHNIYWQELYKNLAPVFGNPGLISEFYLANNWADAAYSADTRHIFKKGNSAKVFWEIILSGRMGDCLEQVLKTFQIKRIEKNLKKEPGGFQPRIRYTSEELEFHPDTSRIFALIENKPGK
ncbi:MAG: hypothetical protein HYW34_00510 [Candidatus Brennerbacteria bacterium]|nr:hypothetical protein [Candidatus Brennerbacteria bacterium]